MTAAMGNTAPSTTAQKPTRAALIRQPMVGMMTGGAVTPTPALSAPSMPTVAIYKVGIHKNKTHTLIKI